MRGAFALRRLPVVPASCRWVLQKHSEAFRSLPRCWYRSVPSQGMACTHSCRLSLPAPFSLSAAVSDAKGCRSPSACQRRRSLSGAPSSLSSRWSTTTTSCPLGTHCCNMTSLRLPDRRPMQLLCRCCFGQGSGLEGGVEGRRCQG